MEWRCEWCGKPHDEDDPPCDNCGHGSFERAVVPATDVSEGTQEAALVWTCTECGREHPKNSPPCSRCGSPDLERSRLTLDESELDSPGYFDLVTPTYALAAAVTVLFAAAVVLGALGIVPIPGLTDGGVPGDSDSINGASLADAEDAFLDAVDERRTASGRDRFQRTDGLDAAAVTINEEWIRATYEDDPIDDDRIARSLDGACEATPTTELQEIPADAAGADPAAAMIDRVGDEAVNTDAQSIGIDTHAGPDGRLFVTIVFC